MRITNRLPRRNVNLSDASPLGGFFKSLVGAVAALAVLYFAMVGAINLVVPHIPVETEMWLAKVFFDKFEDGGQTLKEYWYQQRLDELVAAGPPLAYHPRVHVVESPEINAYALPGGDVVLLTGLLDEVETINEALFVLGHELGHLAHRDHLKGAGRAMTMVAFNLLLELVLGVDVLPDVLNLWDRGMDRSQERAADRFGMDRLYALTGRVDGALAFFSNQRAGRDEPSWAAYFSTHPGNAERLEYLKAYALEKGYPFGQ